MSDETKDFYPTPVQCAFCDWGTKHEEEQRMMITFQCHCGRPECAAAQVVHVCPLHAQGLLGARPMRQIMMMSIRDEADYSDRLNKLLDARDDDDSSSSALKGFMMPEINL